ncbi:MAG: glycosyltransferase family 25 protein [Cyanobacteriota bacterium]|nr:glycosyltransferase family 25 protein [Cyanobacteriota bacterium]
MKFIDFFDRTYVINLPEREDRRKEMTQELNLAGMPFTPNKVELFKAIKPDSPGPFKSIGFRGVFLSHLTILKTAKAEGFKNVLILEDDLEFRKDFPQYEEAIIAEMMSVDWDILNFGYYCDGYSGLESIGSSILKPFSGKIIGTHFYAVNGKVFDRLIDFLEGMLQRPPGHPDGSPMSPDGALNLFDNKFSDVNRLITVPYFGFQRSSPSDITPQWYDRLPVLNFSIGQLKKLSVVKSLKNRIKSAASTSPNLK